MRKFLIVWAIVSVTGWSLVAALVGTLIRGGTMTVALAAVLLSAPMVLLLRGFTRPSYPGAAVRLLVMRPFWYTQLLLPFAAVTAVLGMFGGAVAGLVVGDPVRLMTLTGRWALLVLFGLVAILIVAGYLGSRRLVVRRFVARLPHLPAGFEEMRIVQLTDLHVGPHTSRRKLARVATATRDARPDLIALTGDLVDDYVRDVEPFAAGLGRFEAPLGVFAIPGNHEVYAGWPEVRRELERQGIRVLVNDAVALERGDDRIALLGTGDPAGAHWHRRGGETAAPDTARAISRGRELAGPNGMLIALAHNPVLWPALAGGAVALTLSGHTHWGQLAIPALRWCIASPFLPHAMGAYVERDAVLYVHPGTHYWGLPFRLGTPSEVAVITLRKGPAGFARDADYSRG